MKLAYSIKRALDYSLAAGGLVVAAPALATIAVAIAIDSPGGVLFVQERLGRDGIPFKLLKFRTMRPAPIEYNADGSTRVSSNDARVTRVGRYLRGALDEIPQLINVLRGEMSLIGPRPDLLHQRALYTAEETPKLDALPGLTGLSVVVGRTEIPWKQRISIDVRYAQRWNLGLDLKILLQTFGMAVGVRLFEFDDVLGDLPRAPSSSPTDRG